jgi:hypothetical protein
VFFLDFYLYRTNQDLGRAPPQKRNDRKLGV